MAGTKRRRKSAASSPSKTKYQGNVSLLMSKLLELEPQTALWKDPSTNSNAVWQVSPQYAVSSASATSSPLASSTKNQFSEDTAGFWILLATQTLEMLDASKHANAMAWLSFALGNLVVPHQVDNWSSLVTRHVLARAMYASIMGAVKALYALVQKKSTSSADTGDDGNDADKDKMAILVAVLALDQTVHLWPDPTLPQTKDSAAAAAASTATNTTASTTKGPSFVIQQAWLQARAALYAHAREHYNDTVLSSSFSQTDAWNDDLEACFGALQSRRRSGIQGILTTFRQHSTVYTIYDYSLPSRWTTIVLTTYGQVQTHLLPVLLALLQDEDWEVWKCVSTAAAAATQDSRPAAMTRKRKTTAAVAAVEPATALSGTVVRMALVSRLAKLLTTVTKNHVERGFSSNTPLRNYMDACWSPPSKKKKDGHTDPRDMCTMILYHLVDSHKNDCTPVDEQQPLINEAATPTMINSTFYPFVPDIIDQLAQFVISSLKLSYDEQSQVRQRLECVAAAYILQSGIPDVRCRSFAMLQLHSALLEGSHHASNGAMPVPVLPTRRRNKRAYAGVPIEDRLALFLRALPLAEYWQVLLEGLEQTYDTRRLDTEVLAGTTPGTSIAAAAAAPAKKKRGAKRRKTQPVEELPYRRMTDARASLAAGIWDVVTLSLRHSFTDSPVTPVVQSLRYKLPMDLIYRLMDLDIQRILPQSQEQAVRPLETPFHTDDSFHSYERKVWTSHMNAFICLGRGRVTYTQDEKPINLLGDETRRAIFARVSATASPLRNGWPLWTPPAHRLLVASNISCEAGPADQYIVEGAIASISHFLENITEFPDANSSLEVTNAFDKVFLSLDDARLILTALINLSPKAQMAAFSKLVRSVYTWMSGLKERPGDMNRLSADGEAAGFLARVVVLCANSYSLLRFGPSVRRELRELLGAVQIPVRLFMRVRPSYCADKSFVGVLGHWDYADDTSNRFTLERVDHQAEVKLQNLLEHAFELGFSTVPCDHGQLLFVAWGALGKSDMWSLTKSVAPAKGDIQGKIPSLILELRNELCFVHRIMCRATSRASPKSSLFLAIEERENPDTRKSVRAWSAEGIVYLSAMVRKATGLIEKIAQGFDEDAGMEDESEYGPDSPELLSLLQVLSTYLAFAISSFSRPQVDFFSKTYTTIFDQANMNKRSRGYSTESDHTVSDAEDSSDSQDFALSTFERLQDICERIGAVPSHPDWLDKECRLIDGLSYEKATEVALDAQHSLTKLLSVAVRRTKVHQKCALKATCSDSKKGMDNSTSLAVEFCWLQRFRYLESSSDGLISDENETDVVDDVSKICKVESGVLGSLLDETAARNDDFRTRQWCRSASQRVQGRLHDLFRSGVLGNDALAGPELRAADEWEILLARSLAPASICGAQGEDVRLNIDRSVVNAERWLSIMWGVVESLAPVTALLRFGLSRTGREPHPLSCFDASVDDFDPSDSRMKERLPPGTTVSQSVKNAVMETLSYLSLVPGSEPISAAAAIHLVPDVAVYSTLQGVTTCKSALLALSKTRSLLDAGGSVDKDAFKEVVGRLGTVIEKCGSYSFGEVAPIAKQPLLFAALEVSDMKNIDTIASPGLDMAFVRSALGSCSVDHVNRDDAEQEKKRLLGGLTGALQDTHTGLRARTFFIRALASVLHFDCEQAKESKSWASSQVLLDVADFLNHVDDNALVSFLRRDVCGDGGAEADDGTASLVKATRSAMCYIFSLVASALTRSFGGFTKSGLVVDTIMNSSDDSWAVFDWIQRVPILNCLFLHATVANKLDEVGAQLTSLLQIKQDEKRSKRSCSMIENFSHFCKFIASLQPPDDSTVQQEQRPPRKRKHQKQVDGAPSTNATALPTMCTYAKFSDFYEQHWYQCYTCDLVGDRGCCTLCALCCHEGHDVSYARYSSFFCDCGAEQSNPGGGGGGGFRNRFKCQCLLPQPKVKVERLFRESSRGEKPVSLLDNSVSSSSDGAKGELVLTLEECACLVAFSTNQRHAAVEGFLRMSQPSEWSSLLLKFISAEFNAWKSGGNTLSTRMSLHSIDSYSRFSVSLHLRKHMCQTYDEELPESSSPGCRFFRENTLQMNLSSSKRSYLADRNLTRRALDADSRGRLVIAEGRSLIVCNALALLNSDDFNEIRGRAPLCILKSLQIYFEILGVRLSSNFLVVWGSHDVTILKMNNVYSNCEQRVDLGIDFKSSITYASDSILYCQWLPGSCHCVVVGCRQVLFVYDLALSEHKPAVTIRIPLDSDADARFLDFAVVRNSNQSFEESWKLFSLLSDGTLHDLTIRYGADAKLTASKTILLAGRGLRIAANVSRDVVSAESNELLQGGTHLSYLEQSRALIYQVPGTYAYEIFVGQDGGIERASVLITQTLSNEGESLGSSPSGDIKGPYTHWTELGLVQKSNGVFFRISCVGVSSATSQPVLLCIDFSESCTTVKKLQFEPDDSSQFPCKIFVDGCVALSSPIVCGKSKTECAHQVAERVHLCSATSKGALYFHTQEMASPSTPSIDPCEENETSESPKNPLLAFESLTNISGSVDLFSHGAGLESSEETKAKLLRDNDLFQRSPDSDGFTLNISMKYPHQQKSNIAVAAVRLLFGATSLDSIPKHATVQGMRVKLVPNMKRWYSFQFSPQEMLLGVRSGVISITLSESFNGSTRPILDGLETYAIDRSKLEWLPTSLKSIVASSSYSPQGTSISADNLSVSSRLQLAIEALSSLNIMLEPRRPSERHISLLKEIVQETALQSSKDLSVATRALVASFEPSINDHQLFLDCAAIAGCAQFLGRCCQVLATTKTEGNKELYLQYWYYLGPPFRACLQAASSVARNRPNNYLKAVSNCLESIAVRASLLMDSHFITQSINGDILADFVELSLLESAVARGFGADYDSRGRFAGFDILHRLLVSSNEFIVTRTCTAIFQFCEKYSTSKGLRPGEVDLFAAQPMVVYYGCDGCGLFPIDDVRYSLQDEDHPVDFCSNCYRAANDFATSKQFSETVDVLIRSKTVGDGSRLTCAEVKRMEALQIHRKQSQSDGAGKAEAMETDANEPENRSSPELSEAQVFQRQQLFDEFMDALFATISNLIAIELEKHELSVCALFSLIFDASRLAGKSGHKADRATRLARKIIEGLSRNMQRFLAHPQGDEPGLASLESCIVRFLVALSSLVVPDDYARSYIIRPNDDDCEQLAPQSDPSAKKIKCVHGTVAARRKFVAGRYKGRSFSCCSLKSKAHRCNFFIWLDGDDDQSRTMFNMNISTLIWNLMSHPQSKEMLPLHLSLCNLVLTAMSRSGETAKDECGNKPVFDPCQGEADAREALMNNADGVRCSEGRLRSLLGCSPFPRGTNTKTQSILNGPQGVISASLELMALVAGGGAPGTTNWFSPICQVLLVDDENTKPFRAQAKRALWLLAGKDASNYLDIRDRYFFKIQFNKLTSGTQCFRDYCLLINQKTQTQSRQRRGDPSALHWSDLKLRHIVGAVDLMNENASLQEHEETVRSALNELLAVALKRPRNWKRFCFPGHAHGNESGNSGTSVLMVELLAMTCLLSSELQAKAMKLASLAVAPNAAKQSSSHGVRTNDTLEGSEGATSSSGRNLGEEMKDDAHLQEFNINADDLYSFVCRFVCGDESQEVRRLASQVAVGLCIKKNLAGQLFERLLKNPMCMVGRMGKLYFEFLSFMNALVPAASPDTIDIKSAASTVELLFRKQVISLCCDGLNGNSFQFETRTSNSIQRNRFELSRCAHVILRPHQTSAHRSSALGKAKRLPEQVSPFGRIQLDTSWDSSSSNEFNYFIALPYRCAISEVHVEIGDPRGRYVKTINFYYSPRPIDPLLLKSQDYTDRWQRCGSLDLGKGVEKSTFILKRPVVAANIRVEFSEFYDRSGSPKSDGFVVHCPRCTRVVTNAHGVCAQCGEVCFQCRKCRHINYDRLDAYLCVECGYCASGSLSFGLTAGVASNAVAITSERDYKQATQMFVSASSLFEELQGALRRKLQQITAERGGSAAPTFSTPAIQRAYEGLLPLAPGTAEEENVDTAVKSLLKRFNKRGSVVRAVAKNRQQEPQDRTRRRSDIIRHMRRSEDEDNHVGDEASDLLGGLLESAGMGRGLDPSDPVSRLLATVQRQRERNAREEAAAASASAEREQPGKNVSKEKTFEECERLYRLMHEAQREVFALERRMEAWRRLESGNLDYTGEHQAFHPSNCSICSGHISHQLLVLWQSLFLLGPRSVAISKDFVENLLKGDETAYRPETRRAVVKDVALRAGPEGRDIALDSLRVRLLTLQDMHCAEILRMILQEETDSSKVGPFLELALEAMDSNPV